MPILLKVFGFDIVSEREPERKIVLRDNLNLPLLQFEAIPAFGRNARKRTVNHTFAQGADWGNMLTF